jgi:2-succinyl-5-enolpyruvyl-6-hydroxy-3-cyclohexene-1-carboxylate synthase
MPASPPHVTLLAALVDELVRSGVEHAVVCPGSRNSPVIMALSEHPGIRCWSVVDERSAGFMALGIAKLTGKPAVVTVTSGTALSNLLPAATEAREAGVPMVLLTADRPPELRDVGAGQTIDQLRALDHVARWVVEADLGSATEARERWIRATACRLVATSTQPGRAGAVQLNLPLREPLTAPGPHAPLTPGRAGGQPWLARTGESAVDERAITALAARCLTAQRGVIVAGRSERSRQISRLLPRLAALLNWPLLADPMSGARRGAHAVAAYDLLLGDPAAAQLVPDFVLRIGDLPVSKPLRAWLAGPAAGAPQVMLTPEAVWADPDSVASDWVLGDPDELIRRLFTTVGSAREGFGEEEAAGDDEAFLKRSGIAVDPETTPATADPTWPAQWKAAERAVTAAHPTAVASPAPTALLTEPLVAQVLATTVPESSTLVVGASLPIRMLERWAPAVDHPPLVLSNRGANGIDGVVSTAFGALAASAPGTQVLAYLGDLTLLYDQGGLGGSSRLGLPLQLVVVNNDGGRIFERLPIAPDAGEAFEPLIATPHGLNLSHLAALHSLEHHLPTTVAELTALLTLPADRARLIEIRVGAAAGV